MTNKQEKSSPIFVSPNDLTDIFNPGAGSITLTGDVYHETVFTDRDFGYQYDYTTTDWVSLEQNEIKDIKILLDILNQLPEDNEIKKLFNTQKALNTLRGEDEN
jgi:hypothetical protein